MNGLLVQPFPWNPSSHLFWERSPASKEEGNKNRSAHTRAQARTHTGKREVAISHLVANFCDYKS